MLSSVVPDTLVILALVVTLVVMAQNLRAISFAGITRELGLVMLGLVVWGGFLLVHIIFLAAGPIWVSEAVMLRVDAAMQSWVRWCVETVVAVIILAGVIQIPSRFGRLMQNLEQSTSALEHEHDTRSTLEAELRAATKSQLTARQQESKFLLELSHELRTPLNGIVGLASLLGNTQLDPDQRKLLSTLDRTAMLILARVSAVIDLAQLRTENVEVRDQVFSPAELVRSVEALFAPTAMEKGLDISSEISGHADTQLIGDSRLTRQLLSTMASLAIKDSPTGSLRMHVDLEATAADPVWLSFTATATALELPPDVIERVRQDHGSLRDDGGIGLAICWRLVGLLGGSFDIESQAGVGTVIKVRLPMRREL